MRVPLDWLCEHCDPGLDTAAIEERLTMTGTKVETVFRHGVPSPERFVVGRVLAAEKHPDADKLKVCKVDVGEDEPADVVCGAPNVAAGQTVAVALPGAVMPNGMKIKAAKLRGAPSNGMILSEDELEVGVGHEGIMVLDGLTVEAELAPGTALADMLAIGTDVLELEITPNRPDCLGVYGVARELHAATGAPLGAEPWAQDPGSEGPLVAEPDAVAKPDAGAEPDGGAAPPAAGRPGAPVKIAVECPDLCRRFTARVFLEVKVGPSPPWLKARLMAAGQRPINNVVDVTNYVMLETGQPMHAFDLDKVAGGRLTVRRAHDGEQVTTLDGQVRTLDSEMVVIEDADGPTSIAGVMGGARSEVGAETTRVLMEVANWSGPNIHRTSWALGLRSEASARFEKDLAPEQCMDAQALASRLMVEVCGAKVLPGTIDVGPAAGDRAGAAAAGTEAGAGAARITLRERKLAAVLGMEVPRARQAEILTALGFQAAEVEDGLEVTVPPLRRNDVTREADLIEEVARIHGLQALPATLPARRGAYGRLSESQRARRRAVDALVGRGLYEALGWTFTSPALLDRLRLPHDDPRRSAPTLDNPLSEEQSQLRTTLIGGLLEAAARNAARGMVDVRLFEVGTVFRALTRSGSDDGAPVGAADDQPAPNGTGVEERQMLAVVLSGRASPATWGQPQPPNADLFAVKGVLEALGEALRVSLRCERGAEPFLHPGRAAKVLCDGIEVGWLGELHPLAASEWDLDGAALMEVQLKPLLERSGHDRSYRDVISFPAVRQDLAVVLPSEVTAEQALNAVREAGEGLLDEVRVFDVYSGAQVGEGRRSLAMSLSFRAPDRTLSDEDVAPVRERIVAALAKLGGELRG
jgi:phenylalanyl-tRNA synthetase beta chain